MKWTERLAQQEEERKQKEWIENAEKIGKAWARMEREQLQQEQPDLVNHPPHYTAHPSGVECIQVTEHMGFNLGNAVKYIWRCDLKQDAVEDLRKARWYLDREIERREKLKEAIAVKREGDRHE